MPKELLADSNNTWAREFKIAIRFVLAAGTLRGDLTSGGDASVIHARFQNASDADLAPEVPTPTTKPM